MMQGFLDHLEDVPGLFHRKVWTPRYFSLNEAFHCLEYFSDDKQQHRVGRIELKHAQIATADELGELLFNTASPTKVSSKISIENSRRFVFRIATFADADHAKNNAKPTFHYLCAELPVNESSDSVPIAGNAAASRHYRDEWLRVLRATALKATMPTLLSVAPLDARELQSKVGEYMDQLHLSAHITARQEDVATAKGTYTVAMQAWTLQREMVDNSWQVLEYACSWEVGKTSAQLRDFDANLRQIVGANSLRDLHLPSFTGVRAYLKHKDEEETERRIAMYNSYLDTLLRLPAFSSFGSGEGAMLDVFLEISQHLTAFKRLEAASGQSLKLRNRKIVPWSERERFEQIYRLHLELMRVQEENRLKTSRDQRRVDHHHNGRREAAAEVKHSHRRSHRHELVQSDSVRDKVAELAPVEQVVELTPKPMDGDSVHERIARIGHKLLVEAFQSSVSELKKSDGALHRQSVTL